MHKKKITPSMSDQEKIYQMCNPHPKPLLQGKKQLIRHGSLDYFSPNTVSRKSRYLFLFNDALLIAKREGPQKFWLRIYIHLRSGNCHIVPMWDSPEYEFRLLIDEKGTLEKRKQRRIILYGQNRAHKQAWLDDLMHYHWECTGRKGPDPAPPRRSGDDHDEQRHRPEEKPTQTRPPPQEDHSRDARPDEGNPLLLFDPFAADSEGSESGGYKGVDAAGHGIPRGVMLEPAGGQPGGDPYAAPAYAGTAGYAGAYGGAGLAYAGQGVGASGYPAGYDPSGLYAAASDTSAALGGMFGTTAAGGAAGAGGAGGVGVGGIGAGASGVGTSQPSEFKDNLDDIAQKELQEASKAIEEIAAALAARKRKAPVRADPADESPITVDEVSEAILDATQAIARAASALMRAAAQAQQERLKHYASQPAGTPYHADPAWTNGLVSAARSVVGTTQHLVGVANAAANGQMKEEALVASARAVGAATAQLVSAQRSKSDLTSGANHGLEEAAKGITKATTQLVQAAKVASETFPQEQAPAPAAPSKYTLTEKQIREIEAQTQMLEYEKKAREAREKLLEMRKNEYKEF